MDKPLILKAGKELREWKAKNTTLMCPLCGRDMNTVVASNRVVDHDHTTGRVRGVLCRNCNGLEGRIRSLCVRAGKHIENPDFLQAIIDYWDSNLTTEVYYPGTKLVNGKIVPPKTKKKRRRRVY